MRPESLDVEQRMSFKDNMNRDVVVVSGYGFFSTSALRGNANEDEYSTYDVEILVGPRWRDLEDVSPLLARAWLEHPCSDEDDAAGYFVERCTWEMEGERILLKARVGVRGENASVRALGYQLTSLGFMSNGLNDPGPSA